MKNTLKFLLIALLFVALLSIPLFGVYFYKSPADYQSEPDNYFVVPGIFEDGAILADMQFGGGTSVYLTYSSQDDLNTPENLKKGAEILQARFRDRGYNDAKTTVEDEMIRLDITQKTYLDSVVSQVCTIGEWSFVGSDMTNTICDKTMVESATVAASSGGGYGVKLHFTKDGASEFFANTASYATSGSSFYLMIDGQFTAVATISDASVRDTFTFGSYNYQSAAIIASMIQNGELPGEVQTLKTVPFSATLGKNALISITAAVICLIVLCVAFLLWKGRSAGVFASLALISDAAIFVIALLNGSFQLNFVTLGTMVVCLILGALLDYFAVLPVGVGLKNKKAVTTDAMAALNKFTVKEIWIHGLLFLITLICYLFARGVFMNIVRTFLIFICADFACYFIFLYFGVHTLSSSKE